MIKDDDDFAGKKSKIPYIFVAFFAVILVVNIFYIYISRATWRGVTTDDSYKKGLEYNKFLEQEKKQRQLGWKFNTNIRNIILNQSEITVILEDKRHQVIKDANIIVEFKRPTQDGFDFGKELELKDHIYSTKVNFPKPGQWDIILTATRGRDKFSEAKRYIIKWD